MSSKEKPEGLSLSMELEAGDPKYKLGSLSIITIKLRGYGPNKSTGS